MFEVLTQKLVVKLNTIGDCYQTEVWCLSVCSRMLVLTKFIPKMVKENIRNDEVCKFLILSPFIAMLRAHVLLSLVKEEGWSMEQTNRWLKKN